MADQKAQTRPLSPDQGADMLRDAGTVTGLAQIAILSHADEIAAIQSVRLNREALRLARKYGAQSPEAVEAGARIDQHKSYRQALVREFQRATVPIPPADAGAATIYGRVLSVDEKPQPGFTVTAFAASGKALGRVATGSDGAYLLKLLQPGTQDVTLQALAPNAETPTAQSDPVRIGSGVRVFRDLRVVPQPTPPAPKPGNGDTPPPKREMPNLVGMSETEARAVLKRLGVTTPIKVTTDAAAGTAPGTVLKQSPAEGTALESSTNIALVVSAAAPVKLPDLRKMTLADATIALNQLGLKVGKVTGKQTDGRITGHTPGPGQDAAVGSTVDIRLGKAG